MPLQPIRIPFPLSGLTANRGYETGDIQTTRDCLNVAPDSAEESRVRGGSRTGLTKRYQERLVGTPLFANRVSGGTGDSIYEYMVVGVQNNVYVGESVANSSSYPVSFSESISPLNAFLTTESGDNIIDEDDDGPDGIDGTSDDVDQPLVTVDFNTHTDSNGVSSPYRDRVIINSVGSYLANFQNTATGTVSFTSNQIRLSDSRFASNINAQGIDKDIHVVEISSGQSVTSGTYTISSVETNYLVLTGSSSIGTGSTITYSIREGVRDLNPNTPTFGLLAPTGGYIPLDADDLVSYRDRLVWADGRTWYMSKQGDPGNYDFAADPEDPSRAIAGSNSGPGEPADPINAMAVAGYDYLVFFSDAAVWVMRGDPGYGGQLYQASNVAGCISRTAWCYGRDTEIYFIGKDGLYLMEQNAGEIRPLSKGVLPRELRAANKDNFDVNLVYDPEDNGVLIFVVPKNGTAGDNYIFDVETASFWPIRLQSNDYQPLFAETFGGSPARPRRATLVSRDGYLRDWSGSSDDGLQIFSHVILGPYPIGQLDNLDGFVAELSSVIDEDSQAVTIQLYAESSAEKAVEQAKIGNNPKYSLQVRSGRSITQRPRVRGNSFCVRMNGEGVWAFESLSAMISPAGKTRR